MFVFKSQHHIKIDYPCYLTKLHRQEVLKYELDTVQTQFHAIEAGTWFKLQFTGNCTDAAGVALRQPNTTSKIVGSLDANSQLCYMTLLSSNAYTRRHQWVIGCGLPILWSRRPCKTPQKKKKREKSQSLGFLQKKTLHKWIYPI